jgi:hypothetical protein
LSTKPCYGFAFICVHLRSLPEGATVSTFRAVQKKNPAAAGLFSSAARQA